jgi:hypothetical protein
MVGIDSAGKGVDKRISKVLFKDRIFSHQEVDASNSGEDNSGGGEDNSGSQHYKTTMKL